MQRGLSQRRLHEVGDLVPERSTQVEAERIDVLREALPPVEHVEVVRQPPEDHVALQDGVAAPSETKGLQHLLRLV